MTSYIELSSMDRPKKTSLHVNKGYFCTMNPTAEKGRLLAKKSVQGKTSYIKNSDIISDISGKEISSLAQFDILENYLSKIFILNSFCEYDTINKLDYNTGAGFTNDWARNIMRIDEAQCLKFHDTVLAEVVSSSTRNLLNTSDGEIGSYRKGV